MDCKPAVLTAHLKVLTHILQCLRFIINTKKSVMSLTQELELLGKLVNTNTLLVSLPTDKLKQIRAEAIIISNTVSLSAHLLSHFLGKLSSATQAIPLAPLFYRCLQTDLKVALNRFFCPYHNPPKKNSPGGDNTFPNGMGSP